MQRQQGEGAKLVSLPPFLPEDDAEFMNSVLSILSELLTGQAALTYGSEKSKYSDSWSAD